MTTLLIVLPVSLAPFWTEPLGEVAPWLKLVVHGRDDYAPEAIDYVLGFWPKPGFLKTLLNLKAVFSLGAGVDGFLADPEYPKQVPLVRFVDHSLSNDLARYVVLHTLLHDRQQRMFDAAQKERRWLQWATPRQTGITRVGILGLGAIGTLAGMRLRDLDYAVAGWSRSRKAVDGIEGFVGLSELSAFLGRSDILVCLLPLTADTRHILNAERFAQLPQGAFVINAARGGHLVEDDLIAAIDSGHLSGATLDVFETEPLPQSSPLWLHPKITVTPHAAGVTYPRAAAESTANAIVRHQRGETLDNVVDFARGY